jgi:hypothetical protein
MVPVVAPEAPLPEKKRGVFEVQTANREPNGGARDASKMIEATPRTAMVRMAVQSTDQMPVSILTFRRITRLAGAINWF